MTQTIRVTGADLAARRYGSRSQLHVGLGPAPCPVCGHPTGSCVSDDDATRIVIDSSPDHLVRVDSDVWVRRPSPGAPNTPMTTLAAARGVMKPLSEVLVLQAHGYEVSWTDPATGAANAVPRPAALDPSGVDVVQLPKEDPAALREPSPEASEVVPEQPVPDDVAAEEPPEQPADAAPEPPKARKATAKKATAKQEAEDQSDLPQALRTN